MRKLKQYVNFIKMSYQCYAKNSFEIQRYGFRFIPWTGSHHVSTSPEGDMDCRQQYVGWLFWQARWYIVY